MTLSRDTTLDGILNRRFMLEQPTKGFRVAVDTVFLAAAVDARPSETIIDFGCGVGGAMLALACRVPETTLRGFEIQEDLVKLCQKNIERNNFSARMKVEHQDVITLKGDGLVDHVMMNPPYHDEARHDVSDDENRRRANASQNGELQAWIEVAASFLRSRGSLTLIHRADREDEILRSLQPFFHKIEILHLVPKVGNVAKRVILRASKENGHPLCRRVRPIILHQLDGRFTTEADDVLRDMKPLSFSA